MRIRTRKTVAVASAAVLGLFGAACTDDDNDGNPEIESPEINRDNGTRDLDSPDLDPGEGDGLPGDRSDEAPGDRGATDDLPDVDTDN
jgi:hypothetical protein